MESDQKYYSFLSEEIYFSWHCNFTRFMLSIQYIHHKRLPYQVLLVDLRNHGESAGIEKPGPHNVNTAANDILALLRSLRIFPKILIGHSFGGKVVMSMVRQFGDRLPFPVDCWVLDTLPGT